MKPNKCLDWLGERLMKTRNWKPFLYGTCSTAVIFILFDLIIFQNSIQRCSTEYCKTTECLKEAVKILDLINGTADPCQDLYQFSCGNYLQNFAKGGKLSMEEYRDKLLIDIYKEKVVYKDHEMVKTAKDLFNTCLDEARLETEGLETFKQVLKSLGGWPVLEPNWNADKFSWMSTTYKLRKLGYYYNVFVRLSVKYNPEKPKQHILQMSIEPHEKQVSDSELLKKMTDVAVMFGAKNRTRVEAELNETLKFWDLLPSARHADVGQSSVNPLGYYLALFGLQNWLGFIKSVIASKHVTITEYELVDFPSFVVMRHWLNVMESTSKRDQANYMMWIVLQNTFPFLCVMRNKKIVVKRQTREQFCLNVAEHSFAISPIRLIADNRNFPINSEKRRKVENFLNHTQTALIRNIHVRDWIDKSVGGGYANYLKNPIKVVIEKPKEFNINQILDYQMMVDWVPVKNRTFLSLLAQVNRNNQSMNFFILKNKVKEIEVKNRILLETFGAVKVNGNSMSLFTLKDDSKPMDDWTTWPVSYNNPFYDSKTRTVYIPGFAFQRFFDENRPQYLNYGAMGAFLVDIFGTLLEVYSIETQNNINRLPAKVLYYLPKLEVFQYPEEESEVSKFIQTVMAHRVAYKAYKYWQYENGLEEPLLVGSYNATQLYWISAANVYCVMDEEDFSRQVVGLIEELNEFKKEFTCPTQGVFTENEFYRVQ